VSTHGPTYTPPGWYPDPGGPGQRYWDGATWTAHVQTIAPLALGMMPMAQQPQRARPALTAAYRWAAVAPIGMILGAVATYAVGYVVNGVLLIVIVLAIVAIVLLAIYASNRAGGLLIGAAVLGLIAALGVLPRIGVYLDSGRRADALVAFLVMLASCIVLGVASLMALAKRSG
jgi:uncharacterized protein DUF2510